MGERDLTERKDHNGEMEHAAKKVKVKHMARTRESSRTGSTTRRRGTRRRVRRIPSGLVSVAFFESYEKDLPPSFEIRELSSLI